ncbi:hypothetical protein [Euhalothece natronophila]|nr:hypothetical protein [Euhalothece natronophila]
MKPNRCFLGMRGSSAIGCWGERGSAIGVWNGEGSAIRLPPMLRKRVLG